MYAHPTPMINVINITPANNVPEFIIYSDKKVFFNNSAYSPVL